MSRKWSDGKWNTQLPPGITATEINPSDMARDAGIPNPIKTEEQCQNILRTSWQLYHPVRTRFDLPIYVDSFFRAPAVNELVGGSPTSDHMDGYAIDWRFVRRSPGHLQASYEWIRDNLLFHQLILYPTFIHMALRPEGNEGKAWLA